MGYREPKIPQSYFEEKEERQEMKSYQMMKMILMPFARIFGALGCLILWILSFASWPVAVFLIPFSLIFTGRNLVPYFDVWVFSYLIHLDRGPQFYSWITGEGKKEEWTKR